MYNNTKKTQIERPIRAAIAIQKVWRRIMAQRYVKQLRERRFEEEEEDYGFMKERNDYQKEIRNRKRKEEIMSLSMKKTEPSESFEIEDDDEFAIGPIIANRQFGNDPFKADPPT